MQGSEEYKDNPNAPHSPQASSGPLNLDEQVEEQSDLSYTTSQRDQLFMAAKNGNLRQVMILSGINPETYKVPQKPPEKQTPFTWPNGINILSDTCHTPMDNEQEYFSFTPFPILSAIDDEGRSVIHYASWGGYVQVMKFLLDHGVDMHSRDQYGQEAIHGASWEGHIPLIKYLRKQGVEVDTKDDAGRNPLHYASESGKLSVVKYYTSLHMWHLAGMADNSGKLPMHDAARTGQYEVVKHFVDDNRAIKDWPGDWEGCEPFHVAAAYGHVDIMKLFLKIDKTYLNRLNIKGDSCLHYAAGNYQFDVLLFLFSLNPSLDHFIRDATFLPAYLVNNIEYLFHKGLTTQHNKIVGLFTFINAFLNGGLLDIMSNSLLSIQHKEYVLAFGDNPYRVKDSLFTRDLAIEALQRSVKVLNEIIEEIEDLSFKMSLNKELVTQEDQERVSEFAKVDLTFVSKKWPSDKHVKYLCAKIYYSVITVRKNIDPSFDINKTKPFCNFIGELAMLSEDWKKISLGKSGWEPDDLKLVSVGNNSEDVKLVVPPEFKHLAGKKPSYLPVNIKPLDLHGLKRPDPDVAGAIGEFGELYRMFVYGHEPVDHHKLPELYCNEGLD